MTHLLIKRTSGPLKISSEEEKEFISAIKQGDEHSVRRLASLTWYILKKKLGKFASEVNVNDVFTETLIRFIDQLNAGKYSYRRGKGVVAYFLHISKYVLLEFWEKQKKRNSNPPFARGPLPEVFPPVIQEHPFNQIKDRFQQGRLEKALNEINAKCRRILKKFYYEDFRLKDIAPLVELRQSSMKKTKERCEKKLLKAYYKIFDLHIMHDFHEVH